jgi:lambda family phage tail tape measure protein
MAQAEVLPIELTATHKGGSAFAALRRDVEGARTSLRSLNTAAETAIEALATGGKSLLAVAGLGAVAAAVNKLIDLSDKLGEKALRLREFAATTALSTMQLQALTNAAENHGNKAEQAGSAVQKFTAGWEQMRRGGGQMLEEIRRIDAQLARDMQQAGDAAAAWDMLAQAVDRASVSQRNLLLRAAGGKEGVAVLTGMLGDTSRAGGLNMLAEQAKMAGDVIDKELIQKLATLKAQADAAGERLRDKIGLIGAETELRHAKELREDLIAIIDKIQNFSPSSAWTNFVEWWSKGGLSLLQGRKHIPAAPEITVNKAPDLGFRVPGADQALRNAPAAAERLPRTPEQLLDDQRQINALLGAAVTPAETYLERVRQINAEVEKNKDLLPFQKRALDAAALAHNGAVLAMREQLGIAREGEIADTKWALAKEQLGKAGVKSAEDIATAERIVRKEAQLTAEAIKVRASETPALTRLAIDSNKLATNLDSELAAALRGTTSDIFAMAKGTDTLSAGLEKMSTRILEAVANALLLKHVVGPIAGGLSAGISGGIGSLLGSAHGNVFGPGGLVPFAAGGIVTRPTIFPFANGTGLMGEAGPEAIMPLRRDSQGRLGVAAEGAGGGTTVIVQNYSSEPAREERSRGPDGREMVKVIIGEVTKAIGAGDMDSVLGQRFGSKPVGVRR